MIDKVFVQTGLDGAWVECADDRIAHEDIDHLTCALLILHHDDHRGPEGEFRLYRVGNREPEVFPVGTQEENAQLFREVRERADLVGFGSYHMTYFDRDWGDFHMHEAYWDVEVVPFRWRFLQKTADGALYLAADVACYTPEKNGLWISIECFSICIQMERGIVIVSKTGNAAIERRGIERRVHRDAWTEASDLEIPQNISNLVIEALRISTQEWSGIYPTITWQRSGKQAVLAFAAHPFDWNISVFRSFLGEKVYKKLFPREQKDNFRPLCAYLGIHPTKSLRRAYGKNPYAILWYLLLKRIGVTDLNLIQKFYAFDKDIAGIPFSHARWMDGKIEIVDDYGRIMEDDNDLGLLWGYGGRYISWPAIEYYLHWVKKNKNERAMANEFYRLAKRGITQEMSDTMTQFKMYEDKMPLTLRWRLLKHGLTHEMHDLISEAVLSWEMKEENKAVEYPPEDQTLEASIGDYVFRLVKQTKELSSIGRKMHNCVASYRKRVLSHQSMIVTARRDGEYAICIELDDKHVMQQAYAPHNKYLSGDALAACLIWVKLNEIRVAGKYLGKCDLSVAETWGIEHLPFEKLPSQMSAEELLAIPEDRLPYEYYSSLATALEAEPLPDVGAMPSREAFPSEEEYLKATFPSGIRIWKAAMRDCDPDAQYALGLCYAHGKILPRDGERAMMWLKPLADEGHLQAKSLYDAIKAELPEIAV